LDKGISWKRVASLVREAYEQVAPKAISAAIGKTVEIKAPTATLAPSQLDPMRSPSAQRILKTLRKICLAWPETSEGVSFGFPVWRAGKKTFASAYLADKQLLLSFWVGVERQALLTTAPCFQIPAYMGHNGWIALDVTKSCDWDEVRELALYSYKHFALKRMLRDLADT
jgi:predicted DNA-binding protein (MmcQ/YjbR family)